MGTRADFYVGHGKQAEWIGSVAYDGYMYAEESNNSIIESKTEEEFRKNVLDMLNSRRDSTLPVNGWPWCWETSKLTDYVYWFENGKVNYTNDPDDNWPNMKEKQNVRLNEQISGILIFGV